eukprot:gene3437-8402_t
MESQELNALLADSTRTIEAYTAVLATQYEPTPVTAGDEHAMPPATPVAPLDVAKLQRHQAALYIIDVLDRATLPQRSRRLLVSTPHRLVFDR